MEIVHVLLANKRELFTNRDVLLAGETDGCAIILTLDEAIPSVQLEHELLCLNCAELHELQVQQSVLSKLAVVAATQELHVFIQEGEHAAEQGAVPS